jgi:ATP-dependent DNA helicase DinG
MDKTKYAVVDLEMTGSDFDGDNRIIQIGCAFVENGKIVDTFQSKVNPQRPIPEGITKLTGITDEQVQNAPKFNDIVDEVYRKLVDAVFVAHNVEFDFPFLNQELVRSGYPELDVQAIDTVSLSQIVFSFTKGYRLRDLTSYLKIEHDDPHSADSDAVATAHLLIEIKKHLQQLPIVTLERLVELGADLPRQTQLILKEALFENKRHPQKIADDLVVVDGVALKKPLPLQTEHQVDETKVVYPRGKRDKEQMYNGTLGWRKLQGSIMNFTHQQFSVTEGFKKHVVIEAPTGSGKTLGYLFPLSYIAREQHRKVVISVPTTILQNQILEVGRNQLNQILDAPMQFAILKGSSNYLNLDVLMKNITHHSLSKDSRLVAMKILVWLTKTTTGDFDEINHHVNFSNFVDDIRHHGKSALNPKSKFFEYDFYRRAMQKLKFADFIITNHHYLALHASEIGRGDEEPVLVIDEAQHFPKVVSNMNQQFLDLNELMMETHRLVSRLVMNHHRNLIQATKHQPLASFHIRRFVNSLEAVNTKITEVQQKLFDKFVAPRRQHLYENQPAEIVIKNNVINQMAKNEFHQIVQELANTFIEFDALDRFFKEQELTPEIKEDWSQIKAFQSNLTKFYDALREINEHLNQNIYWVNLGPNHDPGSIRIGKEILDTGEFYREKIETFYHKILLIGGTLFFEHKRSYFLSQFGLHKPETSVRTFRRGVDYEDQLDFEVLQSDFTVEYESNHDQYAEFLAGAIEELTRDVNRQTLVLFNSLETLRNVYNKLHDSDLSDSRRIIAQGIHGSKAKIIREFNDEENAILFGAASFWEGVDFPGDRLEYLIVTRLPFRSPDDRMVQFARKNNRSSFMSFTLPDALLTFKQGIGRLIRNSDDSGVAVMLDNRIVNKDYGKLFIKQLPSGVDANLGNINEVKERVDNFFNKQE